MTEGQAGYYKVDHTITAKEQIRTAAALATQAGKFLAILRKGVLLMQTDPHGWGDPQYRSTFIDRWVLCHGILRSVVYRYVVYEQAQSVVLLDVQVHADLS